MSLLFYPSFALFTIITIYYFIYLQNINYDNLFFIILNFIFLAILPLYYYYFEDLSYSLGASIFLFIASYFLNLKIKEIFHEIKIFPFIYFLLTSILLTIILCEFFYL